MSFRLNKLTAALLLSGALLAVLLIGAVRKYPDVRMRTAIRECKNAGQDNAKSDCIFHVIDSELHRSGLGAAMRAFSAAYEAYPFFANGGCHSRAHRVGDMLYYEVYLGNESLDSIDFTQGATACGYGFFHGFMEHLIQDHPDTAFITDTCEKLTSKLGSRMRDIGPICYHGAGHGLALGYTAEMPKSKWGNINAFTREPLARCSALPEADAREIEQCYEGVFNIMNEYLTTHVYGFRYNTASPFAICTSVPLEYQHACVYEMAQNTDSVAGQDPKNLVKIVSVLPSDQLKVVAFGVGIAGMIQQIVETPGGYERVLAGCRDLPDMYFKTCVASVVGGLFEHGDPQKEYEKPLVLCTDPLIAKRGAQGICYSRTALDLARFYATTTIAMICPQFPAAYRPLCDAQVMHPSTIGSDFTTQGAHR